MGGGGAAKTPQTTTSSKRAPPPPVDTTAPTGCMSAVFHFFDFHHFQFPLNQTNTSTPSSNSSSCGCFKPTHSFLSPRSAFVPTTLKGTEAPRNSLESEEESSASASASTSKEEENLNIPLGIQIKTSGGDIRSKVDTFSEISSSPGTKTPTLVARLMGLDILPESHSPSFSSHLKPITGRRRSLDGDIRGTRSLPETPRMSSSSRRSDVDLHHRLSLQINKENMSATEEAVISRLRALKRKDQKHEDENKSPGHYARQIVKQVKESVSRRVGMDITNTVRNREQAREELVSQFKYKKISRALNKLAEDSSPGKHSTTKPPAAAAAASGINMQPQPKLQPVAEKVKKPRNKQEETFVRPSAANRTHTPDKKCKKTPLSNDLLNIFPVKKDPSPPATKIPQKQVLDGGKPKRSSQLSSCSSQTYNKQQVTYVHVARNDNIGDRCNDDTTTGEEAAEYHEYIARILRRTGLEKETPLSLASWSSPSHPLNPSIFYHLEHFTACNKKTSPTQLSLRCNRKLLFHLTDELLSEFLKPFFNTKPWVPTENCSNIDGSRLIDTLCSKIMEFPRADCRVLEDIDALIGKDLPEMKLRSAVAYGEEAEGVVSEVEKGILEALVQETATDLRLWCGGFNFQRLSNRNVERARLLESHGSFT
ncbi:TON1 Recruiting Motif 25 [Hibiscus trionum]|uniref:TON1 Recruiting Motif 25 n=1 Tax=Hibiscus trionum TaxID=183268 RepID=A0A9W7MRF5_HIBTR|nr:TON1 Recruiting Motif 25 [Hibiscus trionum]